MSICHEYDAYNSKFRLIMLCFLRQAFHEPILKTYVYASGYSGVSLSHFFNSTYRVRTSPNDKPLLLAAPLILSKIHGTVSNEYFTWIPIFLYPKGNNHGKTRLASSCTSNLWQFSSEKALKALCKTNWLSYTQVDFSETLSWNIHVMWSCDNRIW